MALSPNLQQKQPGHPSSRNVLERIGMKLLNVRREEGAILMLLLETAVDVTKRACQSSPVAQFRFLKR